MRFPSGLRPLLGLCLLAVLSACTSAAPAPTSEPSAARPSSTPTRLTLGIIEEPSTWGPWRSNTSAGGSDKPYYLLKRTLTQIDDQGQVQAEVAVSVPSIERGDWRVFPDGTMEQTWQVRPEARWQDGQPLTAEDFVFGWQLETSPSFPIAPNTGRAQISAATAPDPHTLVLTFKGITPLAGQALFDPYPRHLLADAYATLESERFMGLDFWTTGYVGAGPYRLTQWQPGAFQEFAAFPDFVGGRPRIDLLTVRILQDVNALLANVLSGDVEVALPDGLSVETALDLQRGWAAPGNGNQVILFPDGRLYLMEFQFRPDYARPAAARDPRVRRAFYHAIDKDGVNEVELGGGGVLADSWIPPSDPRRPQFAAAIPPWSHDLTLARRLLEEAGWQPGTDGVLVSASTGERLETEIRVTPGQGHTKALAVMAQDWRKVGAAVTETVIPAALNSNGEYRSTFPFTGLTGFTGDLTWEPRNYACAVVPRPENRWNGSGNRGGYCSPQADPLLNRLGTTLSPAERTPLQAALLQIILGEDYAHLPLYWQVTPVAHARTVTGLGAYTPGPYGTARTPWNIHRWEKR